MKFYSEITKKNYDTVEALQEAEGKIGEQFEKKHEIRERGTADADARKESAKMVEAAFARAAEIRKSAEAKEEELGNKEREITKKYEAEFKKIEDAQKEEMEALTQEYSSLNKEVKAAMDEAYEELRKFCKKYGAFHYSVDAGGADLFPMLMGFRRMEKAQNFFSDFFGNMFNLF